MMKKQILVSAVAIVALCAAGICVAEGDVVYGTMQIPYSDFFAAEGPAYEVDSVSSATDSKWCDSEKCAPGTYSVANAEGKGGTIEGTVYPVAISQSDLDALGENNYGFIAMDSVPAAYKLVTVTDGKAAFSAVQGETAALDSTATVTANTIWGDYEITLTNVCENYVSTIGTVAGVTLTMDDGSVYGLRMLENIWFDELGWSVGYVTTEPHGNTLSYANFADTMGKTVTKITYITDEGYKTIETSLYLPVKYEGGVTAENADISAGQTAMTADLPEDFEAEYSVAGLEETIADGVISFTDALPGSYTLTASDAKAVYADSLADFVLSTEELPVSFDEADLTIVPAEGADEEMAETFIANISTVNVNGTDYAATGHHGVAIINDGIVDVNVTANGDTPVFADGENTVTVTAVGFVNPIVFTVNK